MKLLLNVGMSLATSIGLQFLIGGVSHQSPSGAILGVLLLSSCWCWARSDAATANIGLFGTKFFGAVERPVGRLETKWIRFIVPILPIRSYTVQEVEDVSTTFLENSYEIRATPLLGLGISLRSVVKTVLKTMLALAFFAFALLVLEKFNKAA